MADSYRISTNVSRDEEDETLSFKVICNPYRELEQEEDFTAISKLEGFIHYSGQMPRRSDFEVYDNRSNNCLDAFTILTKKRSLIKKQLPKLDIEWVDQIIVLERLWVDPEHRGNLLAHRMMREVQHVFARPQALVILKAHPDGDEVSDGQCVKLAEYYCSDPHLSLKPISKRSYPGWIVGDWFGPKAGHRDFMFWRPDTKT